VKSEIQDADAFRSILYAQAWEDPDLDRRALEIGPADDVFSICASGDNALAFLLDDPRSVTALDFNPSQCHLLELKIQALLRLEHAEVLAFLGVRPGDRAAAYLLLRPGLSEPARAYWDQAPDQIRQGVIHIGRFERYFGYFRRFVLPWIHGRRLKEALLGCRSVEEQADLYARRWDTWRWRLLFRLFFGRRMMGRLGRDPRMFKYVGGNVADTVLGRARHLLSAVPARTNWFLEYIMFGNYRTEDRLPPYLRAENQPVLRERLGRIRLVTGAVEEHVESVAAGSYSKHYLSDIFEYMSAEAAEVLFGALWRATRDGGILSYREMMVERSPPDELRERLVEDQELGARLHPTERAFFYGAHRVLRVRRAPEPAAP